MTYNEVLDKVHDGTEAFNDAAKSLNEVAKEQCGKISQEAASILLVYGLCKVVSYLDNQNGGK